MLSIKYSDPPLADGESEQKDRKTNYDITNYVLKYAWSGDAEQAARKLEFSIAYNTPTKDKVFVPLNLKVGGFIYLYWQDDDRPSPWRYSKGVYSTASG